jgi:hypothetical protein
MTGPALATAAVAGALLVSAPAKENVETILERISQWVERFERDFITVIADETYDQVVAHTSAPGAQHRQIRSELLFMRGQADDTWFAVRNVLAYTDEQRPAIAVPNSRDRLALAIDGDRAGGHTALRRLADEGARFNIGRVARNFNTPTLALQFVDTGHRARFKFRLEGSEIIGAEMAWRLSYEERVHPTLIRANFADTELSGRIWTRVSDGAVLRTHMELTANARGGYTGLWTAVTVDYARDPKLATIVPVRMEEEYRERGSRGANNEVIRGTAVYSNYRVFETSAKVISPQ